MKKILSLIISLIFTTQVQAANLDANLMVIADLHHSQENDEITGNLQTLVDGVLADSPGTTNWLGLADIIDRSNDAYGPYADNISDLTAVFSGAGITFKSLADSHDTAGSLNIYTTSNDMYPGHYWTWDIGSNWRVLAIETLHVLPGYIISSEAITWLQAQLAQADTDGKFVIAATHEGLWEDITWPYSSSLTPSAVSGAIQITSDTADTFAVGDVGKQIALRTETCPTGVESCWGYGTVTAFNSDTSVDVTVVQAFANTTGTMKWNWGQALTESPISNSAYIRSLLEDAGSSIVKLAINGHMHANTSTTINGIEYVQTAAAVSHYGEADGRGAKSGGLLYLYDDGTWSIAGTGKQTSYNWGTYYVSASGSAANGGAIASLPLDMATINSKVSAGGNLFLTSDVEGDLNLTGTAENHIKISSHGARRKITGNIGGDYLDIEGIDMAPLKVISANNSSAKNIRSVP